MVNGIEGGDDPDDLPPLPQAGLGNHAEQELHRAGHTTKSRTPQDARHRAGKPIDKCALYKILNNRVYLGDALAGGS